ncbi:CMRF35-like molecule 5 isoform X2 [Polyodon spathula]|uniref:CMRF35-like molecule 5 isoform X2 n=1 Tax=Polyodon spathula TaxID=7913 RepID=UPI001B7EC68B|nr:CMRF35-like molecule 5 isoform X2 [Polyodon spathula]
MEHCTFLLKFWNLKCFLLLLLHFQAAFAQEGPGSAEIRRQGVIPYTYDMAYIDYNKYWCHGYYRRTCTVIADSSGKGKEIVEVKDDKKGKIDVTIKQVIPDGHYWCGIEMIGLDSMAYTYVSIIINEAEQENIYRLEYIIPITLLVFLLLLLAVFAVWFKKKSNSKKNRGEEKKTCTQKVSSEISLDNEVGVTYSAVQVTTAPSPEGRGERALPDPDVTEPVMYATLGF